MDKIWIKAGDFHKLKPSDVEGLTEDQVKSYQEELYSFLNEKELAISKQLNDLEKADGDNTKEISKLKSELNGVNLGQIKDTLSAVKAIGLEMAKMKEGGTLTKENFEGGLKKAFDSAFNGINDAMKSRTSHSFSVKAAQTYGDINSGEDFAQMRAGIIDKPLRKPKIRALFGTIPVNTEFYKYTEQDTVIRDAKNVAKCASVTSTTKETLIVRSIETKIVKDMIDFCRLFVDDYDFMRSRINRLIEQSLSLRIDSQLLLGDGTGENLFSIDSTSSEFSAANAICVLTTSIQAANMVDLILGMQTQIIELGDQDGYDPDVVLVNKCDWFKNVESVKDSNNNYLDSRVTVINGVPFVGGMMVMWTPIVVANTLYVLDSTKGEIVDRQFLTLDVAFENRDNWEKEIATLKGYERLNFLVPNNWKNAFMKCSDVGAAITAITKP